MAKSDSTWPPRVSRGKKIKSRGEREREGRAGERERGMDGGNSRRERERGREIRQEEERSGESGREEDFPPPASSRDGSNFRREETRGERRGKSTGEREEKFSSSFSLSAHMPACRRGGRKMGMGKRERSYRTEIALPSPLSSRRRVR